jgi:hypothetical protein
MVGNDSILGNNFLRSDIISSTNFEFNIKSNKGLNLGIDSSFNISNDTTGAFLYNKNSSGDIDFRFKRVDSLDYNTVVRVTGRQNGRVGINKPNPQKELDIVGSIQVSEDIFGKNILVNENVEIRGKILVENGIEFSESANIDKGKITNVNDIVPRSFADLGTTDAKWSTLYVERIGTPTDLPLIYGNFVANQIVVGGTGKTQLTDNITANTTTITVKSTAGFIPNGKLIIDNEEISYTSKTSTEFQNCSRGQNNTSASSHSKDTLVLQKAGSFGIIDGVSRGLSNPITLSTSTDSDIEFFDQATNLPSIAFQDAGQSKIIKTKLSPDFIRSKTARSFMKNNDFILVQDGSPPYDYYKLNKSSLADNIPTIHIGTILLFTGKIENIPDGYYLCDGSELVQTFNQKLFNVIGYRFRAKLDLPSADGDTPTFCLPDLRGSVPNFSANQVLKGISYIITELGQGTNWTALGYRGTPAVNIIFTANWEGNIHPGTGTGRAILADGLHYIIFNGNI